MVINEIAKYMQLKSNETFSPLVSYVISALELLSHSIIWCYFCRVRTRELLWTNSTSRSALALTIAEAVPAVPVADAAVAVADAVVVEEGAEGSALPDGDRALPDRAGETTAVGSIGAPRTTPREWTTSPSFLALAPSKLGAKICEMTLRDLRIPRYAHSSMLSLLTLL